jgi:uncharacterized membrane protein YccF (DUF307 family)
MKTIGNIIWLALAGFWLALGYVIAGLIACVFIVTIPFGLASFRLAGYALWPFGRMVIPSPTKGAMSGVGNIIWAVVAGWWLALGHIITALLLAVTIVGLPLAAANVKMIGLAFAPFGKQIVKTGSVTTAGSGAVAVPELG